MKPARMATRGLLVALAAIAAAAQGTPVISNVRLQQRPDARHVDILYDLTGGPAIVTLAVETNGVALPDQRVTRLTGDVSVLVQPQADRHIVWDARGDWPEAVLTGAKARVTAWATNHPPAYLVVDLSGGIDAAAYPMTYHASAEALPLGGLTNGVYRTSRLVLRRIRTHAAPPENGLFLIGSPNGGIFTELGINAGWNQQHEVRLTRDYYIGVYEVTQQQWRNVMGAAQPAFFTNPLDADMRPMEQVSWTHIRGANDWPSDTGTGEGSFMRKLRDRCGAQGFDLPTEAQWEYAARAGTVTALNSGVLATNLSFDANLYALGRTYGNGGFVLNANGTRSEPPAGCTAENGTARVGSYLPNAWGLYDTHGNVNEWCLDKWVAALGTVRVTDPAGGTDATTSRACRGGCWRSGYQNCRSAFRNPMAQTGIAKNYGFRVVRNLP